ncbi:MAG: PAS domain S-box protein [Bacteroidales bacterium]|nr:PAS domain S-box protein [Bacteroidales bacterium]
MSEKIYIVILGAVVLILIISAFYVYRRSQKLKNYLFRILITARNINGKINKDEFKSLQGEDMWSVIENLDSTLAAIKKKSRELEQSIFRHSNEIEEQNRLLISRQKEAKRQNLEIKSAFEALVETRLRYEKLVDNLKEEYIFFSQSTSGELLFVSVSVKNILGYEVNEFRRVFDKIYTDNPINIKAREHRNASLKGIQQPKYLVELSDKSGMPHVLEITEFPVFNEDNEFISVEGIARDITSGIRAEDLIQEKEEKYKLLFNKASDFIFFYRMEKNSVPGKFLEVNDYTVNRLGYTKEELLNMGLHDLTSEEFSDGESEINEVEGNRKYEQIWYTKSGDVIHVEIVSLTFKLRNKNIGIAIARDITERKLVEEEIRYYNEELVNQKENLEALVDNLTQTQEQLVHSEKMAALGQLIAGVAHEINTPLGAIKASIGNLNDSLGKAISSLPVLLEKQTSDAMRFLVKILGYQFDQTDDLTTREKRLIRKELTKNLDDTGIKEADTIADLLVYLNLHDKAEELHSLLKMPEAAEILRAARNFMSIIRNSNTITLAADKAAKVVFALKKYAHHDIIEDKIPTDIIDGLETVLTLYHNLLKQGVKVIRKYDELPVIGGYPDDLNQVWTNLIHNSIQAMDMKGTLIITARNEGEYVSVSIADTGCGIEPDIRDKIYEPFFTTKKQGEGSGLGLDIVKRIVEKHNGTVTFTSELGNGTEFIIKLPVKD